MAKKIYAIKEGFDFENNIKIENKMVHSWSECLKYVKGVKGAKYKSFTSKEEVEEYFNKGNGFLKKGVDEYPLDKIQFYVDGSYNQATERYSYAVVAVKDEIVIHIENGAAKDNNNKSIRQIAGELEGAIKSLNYAVENKLNDIVLLHDYVGVCYHATGFWERKEESSKKYYEEFNKLIKDNKIEVTFVKVDSHTGDLFNELVDEFAKDAIGIPVKGETIKYLKNNMIKVKNKKLKEKIMEITDQSVSNNIVVVDDKENKNETETSIHGEIEKLKKIVKEDNDYAKKYINNMKNVKKNELIYFMIKNFTSM
ncbi:ribonuclease H family protein [Clostridium aestuarii]|uniref:Ribonuclease H family protein n=1 Tax=Clostridium aestuarii TaxID=338193 RepID=A0ABT4CZY0_9CLOT|nr:ribonuclease H family protein [Clostridium aestuarii]MCY6484544.1 ribonuclease H family protein [Clostridium aestuarii]